MRFICLHMLVAHNTASSPGGRTTTLSTQSGYNLCMGYTLDKSERGKTREESMNYFVIELSPSSGNYNVLSLVLPPIICFPL
jgi:hypothetical protein